MTIGTQIAAVLAAGVVATGAVFGAEAGAGDDGSGPTALVIDASLARDGRELVDRRLQQVDAEVRLPRNAEEARINVRYFEHLGYKIYVAGAQASEAARDAGVAATALHGVAGAARWLR